MSTKKPRVFERSTKCSGNVQGGSWVWCTQPASVIVSWLPLPASPHPHISISTHTRKELLKRKASGRRPEASLDRHKLKARTPQHKNKLTTPHKYKHAHQKELLTNKASGRRPEASLYKHKLKARTPQHKNEHAPPT